MIEVVAALMWDKDKFMICQRPANKARGLLWEFVGGKVEVGETMQQALIRECREELAVTLSVGDVFMDVVHDYPDLTVHLTLFHATISVGTPQKLEHNDIRWITIDEISNYDFCPADKEILENLKKIKKYHKLVRDKIPDIITASGKQCVCETLSDEQYMEMLNAKLNEELAEYQESKSLEELADLLEVMRAVIKARGYSMEDIERIRTEKAVKRGGFEKKILLREVLEKKMDYEALWYKILISLGVCNVEIHTVPSTNRTPLWLLVSRNNDMIMASCAADHRPSVDISSPRNITKHDFLTVASYYERWHTGETWLRQETRELSRNTAYIFALIAAFSD